MANESDNQSNAKRIFEGTQSRFTQDGQQKRSIHGGRQTVQTVQITPTPDHQRPAPPPGIKKRDS